MTKRCQCSLLLLLLLAVVGATAFTNGHMAPRDSTLATGPAGGPAGGTAGSPGGGAAGGPADGAGVGPAGGAPVSPARVPADGSADRRTNGSSHADGLLTDTSEDTAQEVIEEHADVIEEPNPVLPKTQAQLLAEELQRREDELLIRQEEQGRRDAEMKLREEEQHRRDEELKRRAEETQRRADAELLVQQELERRAAAEELVQQELARRAAAETLVQEELARREEHAATAGPDISHAVQADVLPEEEEHPQPTGGRGGFRPPVAIDDSRNKRDHNLHADSTTDNIALRKQGEQKKHGENLSRKEEIEIEHLESGLAHETAGVDQHAQEVYRHDQINQERDDMIHRLELERQKQEEEVQMLEEMRKREEMERSERERQDIIQEENRKRHMDMASHQHGDHARASGSSRTLFSVWTLLIVAVAWRTVA